MAVSLEINYIAKYKVVANVQQQTISLIVSNSDYYIENLDLEDYIW